MSVLNLQQVPGGTGAPQQGAGPALLSALTNLLHPIVQSSIEQQKSERARSGLEQMLNPPQEQVVSTPQEQEQQNAQEAVKTQTPAVQSTGPNSLLDLFKTPKQSAEGVPAANTLEANAPETQQATLPQSTTTDVMPKVQMGMVATQPGSRGYRAVAAGQTPEIYGQVASAHMAPKTLEQVITQKVESGELTPEEAFAMKNQWSMTPAKLAGRAMVASGKTSLEDVQNYLQGSKLPNDYTTFYRSMKQPTDGSAPASDAEIAKAWQQRMIETRSQSKGRSGTSIPGVTRDAQGSFYDAENRKLSTDEVRYAGLSYREMQPTESTKTMQQTSPKVLNLAARVRENMDNVSLGPLAGRWQEVMTNKVGAPNEEYKALATDVALLETSLMRMHTGARGGQYIMQHFKDMLDAGKQSPENLRAALNEIEDYANDVGKSAIRPLPPAEKPKQAPQPAVPSSATKSGNRFTITETK